MEEFENALKYLQISYKIQKVSDRELSFILIHIKLNDFDECEKHLQELKDYDNIHYLFVDAYYKMRKTVNKGLTKQIKKQLREMNSWIEEKYKKTKVFERDHIGFLNVSFYYNMKTNLFWVIFA